MTKNAGKTRARSRKRRIDHKHWGAMAYWTLEEGAALCLRIDPIAVDDPEFKEAKIFDRFAEIRELADRSREAEEIQEKNAPQDFLRWARRKHIRIPSALQNAVGQKGKVAS